MAFHGKKRHNPETCRVCICVREGLDNAAIAKRLKIATATVSSHNRAHGVTPNAYIRPARELYSKRVVFEGALDRGLTYTEARKLANMSASHASRIVQDRNGLRRKDRPAPVNRDDEYVAHLIQFGGLPRLSEKPTRTGPVVCLPLIPFERAA